jgi:SAM-dependent methyltransferase/uncharacterized protein YbaR (Trm112 family)
MTLSPLVRSVLACPRCRGPLTEVVDEVACDRGHRFPIVAGVPVFSSEGRDVERRPPDHVSHQPVPGFVERLGARMRPWLHLGAGATNPKPPNSIELETAIFATTDVVGDAAALPFADGSLSGTLALNVFEHLYDPEASARELMRVVEPDGVLIIQTAFLQPLHADPSHYFNVTEPGVRRWFRDFDIESVTVPGNFNPLYTFAWLSSDLLFHASEADRELFASTTLAEVAELWRDPARVAGPLGDAFRRLGDVAQRSLAAGFQVVARRPAG